jgi:hypothetical protein
MTDVFREAYLVQAEDLAYTVLESENRTYQYCKAFNFQMSEVAMRVLEELTRDALLGEGYSMLAAGLPLQVITYRVFDTYMERKRNELGL